MSYEDGISYGGNGFFWIFEKKESFYFFVVVEIKIGFGKICRSL